MRIAQMLATLLITLPLSGCLGWFSQSLPPSPTRAQIAQLQTLHFSASVAVVGHELSAIPLRDSLRATGLFDRVELAADLTRPDLLVTVSRWPDRANPLPFITMLSLGIIPLFVPDEYGWECAFRSPKTPFEPMFPRRPHGNRDEPETVCIDARYRGSSHMGWVAILTGLWPGRTLRFHPEESSRYVNSVAAKIADNAGAIRDLIPGPPHSGGDR